MKLTHEMVQMREQGKSFDEIAAAVGGARSSVRLAFVKEGGHRVSSPRRKGSAIGISMEEFLEEHDPTAKMRSMLKRAVAVVMDNSGRLIRDCELRREVGCGDSRFWADIARDPSEGFTKYQFKWKDDLYWSDPATVSATCKKYRQAKALLQNEGGAR